MKHIDNELSTVIDMNNRPLTVLIKDKYSAEIIGTKLISRAELAKYFSNNTSGNGPTVVGANNGMFIVQI